MYGVATSLFKRFKKSGIYSGDSHSPPYTEYDIATSDFSLGKSLFFLSFRRISQGSGSVEAQVEEIPGCVFGRDKNRRSAVGKLREMDFFRTKIQERYGKVEGLRVN